MWLDIAVLIAGLSLLVWSADRFVIGSSAIARNLGVSPLMIGLTIVAFGTSAPEMMVGAMSSFAGSSGLAIGNALGSNIANIALVIGVTALVTPLTVRSETLRREFPLLLAVTLLALLLMSDGDLGRIDGLLLLSGLAGIIYWLVRLALRARLSDPIETEYSIEIPSHMPMSRAIIWFLLGLVLLLISSKMLVWSAVHIAQAFGISDVVIGLSIVAVGTSLPELAASVMSALKKEHDIAIGNVLGSNMYNLLGVMAMPGLIAPGRFLPEILARDFPVVIGLTLALFVMGYGFGNTGRVNRLEGACLLMAFVAYMCWIFIKTV